MGTANILEACRNCGENVKSVVVSASDKAFGNAPVPYTEESPLNPLYIYDTSKACQSLLSLCYFHNFDVPTKVVASSNIYGPGDYNISRIIPNTLTRLLTGQKAQLNSKVKDFVREFVYIDDAVNAFITTSRKGKNGELYCCGGTSHLKICDLIEKMCDLTGRDFSTSVESFNKPVQFKEIKEQYIDSSKLKSLGWEPKTSLEEGLKKCVDFYSEL